MTFKKLLRKLNSHLRQARKFRTPLILIMGLGAFWVFQNPKVSQSDTMKKLEGQAIDLRFMARWNDAKFLDDQDVLRQTEKLQKEQGIVPPSKPFDKVTRALADFREKYLTFGTLDEYGQHPKVELVGITTQSLDQGLLTKLLDDQLKYEEEQEAKSGKKTGSVMPPAAQEAVFAAPGEPPAPAPAAEKAVPAPAPAPAAEKAPAPAPVPAAEKIAPAPAPAPAAEKAAPAPAPAPAPAVTPAAQTAPAPADGSPVEVPGDRKYSDALKLMGKGRWPLPRAVYSYALERLFELGAKTIVIDILYVSSQTSLDPRLNAALDRIDEAKGEVGISDDLIGELEAVLGDEGVLTPAVYLGLQRLEAAKSQLKLNDSQMARIQQILKREGKRIMDGDEPFAETLERHKGKVVLAFSNNKSTDENGKVTIQFLKPNPVLTEALGTDGLGYAFFQPDVDGVVRRVETFTSQFKESNMGHLQSGADDWLRFSPLGVQKFTGKAIKPQSEIINYRGAAGTFEVLPIEELFSDTILKSDPRYDGGNRFKDKLIYLGPISETFHDEHRTPLGTQPGVEIHAHYGAALIDENPISEFPKNKELWLLVGALIVSALLLMALERVLLRMGIGVAVIFGYVAVSYIMFATKHVMMPVVVPLLAVLAVGGVITMFDFAIEQLEKAHVRGVLDKYVSSNVASMVINQGDSFDQALRGQNKAVSVLFSDIRGFTTLSESRTPEKLVEQLNEYFLQMVDRVLGQQGTLQKFIGDAIMAVWGDTHSLGTDVDCMGAVRAALKMRDALNELNSGWTENADREQLSIGIGINHGHVIVGELGHPQRMEFTCLGDGVNLAARLESATKQFGVDILVAEEAEKLTRDKVVYRRVDLAVFKGKTQPIAVFSPLGEVGIDVPAWLGKYHAALDLFHERKFDEARTAFDAVNGEMGGEDYLCKMYHKRCDHYIANPPPEDWNGSWVLTDK